MADDQRNALSVFDSSKKNTIGQSNDNTTEEITNETFSKVETHRNIVLQTRVQSGNVDKIGNKNKVGVANLEDDEEDRGCSEFDKEEKKSTRYLPQLVFLDSEENISEFEKQTFEDTHPLRQERTVSDSFVTGNLQIDTLQILREAHDHNSNGDHSTDKSKHQILQNGACVQTSINNNSFTHGRHSNTSLHSSTDSELITDHRLSRDDSFEQFMMEEDSKLNTWHCHSRTTTIPPDKTARNQLIAVSILCFMFMIGEAIGGALSNSLALFTDVLHLGSDLISFLISLLAIYLAKKPATRTMSFGYYRAEVVGALVSVFIIWSVTGVLIYMAIERIIHEHYKDVKADEMLITAVLGVVFNIVMGVVLHSEMCCKGSGSRPSFGHGHSHGNHSHGNQDHNNHNHLVERLPSNSNHRNRQDNVYEPLLQDDDNLQIQDDTHEPIDGDTYTDTIVDITDKPHPKNINVRAAFIHVIGDIIQSLGVLCASLIIKFKPEEKYRLADPICTFLFSFLVLLTTITVMRDTLRIIMEGVPRDTDYYSIKTSLQKIPGVKAVHGLSVWCLTLEKNALAVHLAADPSVSHKLVLYEASEMLKQKYSFVHTTIQVEDYKSDVMATCTDCQELYK